MKRYSVTLIGMGPRGLSVFERLAAHARASLCPIDLILIEPGPCGPGVHAARQPQHLVMDTPAGQVTVFPVAGTLDPAPACVTPTLAEWARAQGLRRYGAEVHRAGEGGAAIGDDDYLPRQLLGRYLAWAYGAIAASLPPTVRLEHLRHRAVDMVRQPDGGFVVELDSGFCVASDFVFLATGPSCRQLTDEEAQLRKFAQDHSRCNSRLRYLRHVYPLEQLGAISQQAEVAIGGMGAVAHDVLAELTVGRGGRFEQVGEQLRYVASSQEPRMTLFSRTGLAPCARACARRRRSPSIFLPLKRYATCAPARGASAATASWTSNASFCRCCCRTWRMRFAAIRTGRRPTRSGIVRAWRSAAPSTRCCSPCAARPLRGRPRARVNSARSPNACCATISRRRSRPPPPAS